MSKAMSKVLRGTSLWVYALTERGEETYIFYIIKKLLEMKKYVWNLCQHWKRK